MKRIRLSLRRVAIWLCSLIATAGLGLAAQNWHQQTFPEPLHVLSFTDNLGEVERGATKTITLQVINPHLGPIEYQPYSVGCAEKNPDPVTLGFLQTATISVEFDPNKRPLGNGKEEFVVDGTWADQPWELHFPYRYTIKEASHETTVASRLHSH